jgi:protein-tyrosine-phosphatase
VSEPPIRVLFVCYHNATRSILAEALLRHVAGDRFEAASAGIEPTVVHPLTERVLDTAGIDRTGLRAKSIESVRNEPFDYVITLCDDSRAVCPVFPGADHSLHWGYRDPASVEGTDGERLAAFERVFVQLGERVRRFVVVAGRSRPAVDAVEA